MTSDSKDASVQSDGSAIASKLGIDATLLSNFTHQIINPLNGVIGTIDGLIDGTVGADKREQRLSAVRAQLSHAVELVRNLAFLAQLSTEAGVQSLRASAQWVNLPEAIIEGLQFFDELAKQKRITLNLQDREMQYFVQAHKNLLKQVFLNIVENDVKYGDEESQVRIEMREQKKTGNFLVEVVSQGPGFDYSERSKLFDLGFRGRSAREKLASGSGLGLYLAKRIVEVYGATIEAEYSETNRRTVFRLRFPTYRFDTEATNEFRRTHAKKP